VNGCKIEIGTKLSDGSHTALLKSQPYSNEMDEPDREARPQQTVHPDYDLGQNLRGLAAS
jgi:hypothetical protein